ncbi:MAG TPA: [protein-PII] uridylyltransferase, partial [Opitutaceae bacterium]|nr:[protein-PII] uridylyltransferase [Opitutaceae bacterium]
MPETLASAGQETLHFSGLVPIAGRVAACRQFLKDRMAELQARHEQGASGLDVAHGRAEAIDAVLRALFDYAVTAGNDRPDLPVVAVALAALGGYGRGELSPWSDIDFMFLYPAKTRPAVLNPYSAFLAQEILYVLWDCGLKVGYSTRTVDQVFVEARKDMLTKTALLEARLVAGSAGLFDGWERAYRKFYEGESTKDYITQRLEDQAQRRAKFADTIFNQEPDVKSGVGGLRDFHSAMWMARVRLGVSTVAALAEQNYVRPEEAAEFARAHDFLLRVRNDLHFQSARATDILSLDMQPRVAWDLGYRQEDPLRRVERFMQDYYGAAQAIFRTARLIERRLAADIGRDPLGGKLSLLESLRASRFKRSHRLDGFIRRGAGELAAESPSVFTDDPVRLIRVFRHAQQLDCGISFGLAELIRANAALAARVIDRPEAAVAFRAILGEAGAVYPALSQMHELGVLGSYVPEFGALNLLVQHELYHRYTADIHTLNAIRELDLVFTAADGITLKYRDAIHETEAPDLVYLTLLLHDIGK